MTKLLSRVAQEQFHHQHVRMMLCSLERLLQRGPELLPRDVMLAVCCDVISVTSGKLQQLATNALVETAKCASGEVSR